MTPISSGSPESSGMPRSREMRSIGKGKGVNHTLRSLDDIIARGAMTAAERASVVHMARIVLLMLH